ncbi:ChaB-like protein [Thysanoplusia orichalcea nucleopolyhedrovirus]|uniref:ChaB-like protein n=1 Tax=Thysanoplusia orichalcea nucleopolyhedrovirus TaxID=101850 RepID=L0CL85_9ABAC|nr:ChaB-like protein [Thysanoplusia orichalcea nucleopolyhedrovirus]AGA16210.1 ChaB-like protein [Thysanoplusia orichalcea nucleopolyhedrovirus]
MYQIPDMLYNEKMPPRAKKLFVKTFTKYHKMNGGDEDIAMHKARKALEQKYVKIDTIQNSWIPRKAAYEIVRNDIDESDDNDDYNVNIKDGASKKVESSNRLIENNTTTDYETEEEEDEDQSVDAFNNRKRRVNKPALDAKSKKKYPIGKVTSTRKRSKQNILHYDTSEEEDEEEDKYYNY